MRSSCHCDCEPGGGGGGVGGDVNVLCDCKVLLHFTASYQRRYHVVERRHQLLRRAVQIYMDDTEISGIEAVHGALTWVEPSLNEHTFVNGFTPTELAMGRQPAIPSEERTKPPQLSEGQHLQEILQRRFQA